MSDREAQATKAEPRDDQGDYFVSIKIQNGRIRELMRDAGIATASELARRVGVGPSVIGNILNFKIAPMRKTGEWLDPVLRIADVFGCLPDEMFSPEQLMLVGTRNTRDFFVTHDEAMALASRREADEQVEEIVDRDYLAQLIESQIEQLSEREQAVLKARFGFDGGEEMTYGEIGATFGLSRERIRQIETKALRNLRKKKRALPLLRAIGADVQAAEKQKEKAATSDVKWRLTAAKPGIYVFAEVGSDAVPSGTVGVIEAVYEEGFVVAWDLAGRPLPAKWRGLRPGIEKPPLRTWLNNDQMDRLRRKPYDSDGDLIEPWAEEA